MKGLIFTILAILIVAGGIAFIYFQDKTVESIVSEKETIKYKDTISNQIIYNGITLDDHTQVSGNTAYAERFGMNISLPFTTQDIDGKDILLPVKFRYNGAVTRNVTWIFIFEGQLESGGAYIYRDVTETYDVSVPKLSYVTNYLVSGVSSYNNLGTPDNRCNIGSVDNNTQMYAVTITNGTVINYCFQTSQNENATAFRISGSYWGNKIKQESKVVNKRIDITDKFTHLGNGLLNDDRSYYQANQRQYSTGDVDNVEIVFTPKDKEKTGKFHILGYETEYGLHDSIIDNRYIYLDPWWNSTWTYRRNLTLLNYGTQINLTFQTGMETDFSDLRFTNSSDNEISYYIESYLASQYAIIHLSQNDSVVKVYYNNSAADYDMDLFDIYKGLKLYYPFNGNGNDLTGFGRNITPTANYSTQNVFTSYYSSSDQTLNTSLSLSDIGGTTGAMTINFWLNWTGGCTGNMNLFGNKFVGSDGDININCDGTNFIGYYWDGGIKTAQKAWAPFTNTYQMWTWTLNQTSWCLYHNVTLIGCDTTISSPVFRAGALYLLNDYGAANGWDDNGFIDDFKLYNYSFNSSDVARNYRSYFNTTYTLGTQELESPANSITVVQSIPINNTKVNAAGGTYTTFVCNYTSSGTNNNISKTNLSIYNATGVLKYGSYSTKDNSSNQINETDLINLNTDGLYNWLCQGYSTSGVNATTGYRTVLVDKINPTVSIVYPTATNYNKVITEINYTFSDTNIASCWYSLNLGVTNTSVACGTNVTGLTSTQGSNTWILYANDSAGNLGSGSVTFIVDSASPLVGIISPTNNSYVKADSLVTNIFGYDSNLDNLVTYLHNSSSNIIDSNTTLITSPIVNRYCYQEFSNVSSSCGGLSTGNYTVTGNNWENIPNLFDGNWATYSRSLNLNGASILVNYNKPLFAFNATIQIAYNSGVNNYSIPDSCFNYLSDRVVIRIESERIGTASLNVTCADAASVSDYHQLLYVNGASEIYEEAINWFGVGDIQITNFTSLTEGKYFINASATDSYSNVNKTETRTFTIDTTKPVLTISSPTGAYDYFGQSANFNISLNYYITDTNPLTSCWYYTSESAALVYIPTCTNSTIVWSTIGTKTVYLYGNDSANNIGNVNSTFTINTVDFEAVVYETDSETFLYSSTGNPVASAKLWYANTSYTATVTDLGSNNYNITRSLDIPLITNGLTFQNKTLQWQLLYTNGTTINGSLYQQTVNQVDINVCNATITAQAINITFYNISSLLPVKNVSYGTTYYYWLGDGSVKRNDSFYQNNTDEFDLCYSPAHKTLKVDSNMEFDHANYHKNSFYYFYQSFTNVTTNQLLYLLSEGLGTITTYKVYDQTNLPLVGYYIKVYQYDSGTNTNYLYSVLKTNQEGQDIVYVNWYDTFYKHDIYNGSGTLEFSGQPYKIGETPQLFRVDDDTTDVYGKFPYVQVDLDYDNDTRTFTATFLDPNAEITHGCLRVIYTKGTNQTILSDECLAGTSGTLDYTISDLAGGYYGVYYSKGSLSSIKTLYIIIRDIRENIYAALGNDNGTWIAILLVGSAAFIGIIYSPAIAIIFTLVGLIGAFMIGLIGGTDVTYGGIIIGLIIMAYYLIGRMRV